VSALWSLFLRSARRQRAEEQVVTANDDDPRRSPNWCWTHNMLYPACAGMH
jgi:hypothetical protein